jgi:hypothetical protein
MLRSSSASCEPAAARPFSSAFPTRLHETHVLDPKHRKLHTHTRKGKAEQQPDRLLELAKEGVAFRFRLVPTYVAPSIGFMQAPIKAFASHNWGSDALNHKRVVRLCTVLRERGVDVWLDETHMKGNILDAMCKGIDESDVVLVFVTREYIDKVQGGTITDNCRREFMYASQAHAQKMIAVRFDADLGAHWSGPVGMVLGSTMYADMAKDPISDSAIESLVKLMQPHARPRTAVARTHLRSAGGAGKIAQDRRRTSGALEVSGHGRHGQSESGDGTPRDTKPSSMKFGLHVASAPVGVRDIRTRANRLANILNFHSTDLHIAQIVNKAAETLGLSLGEELKFHDRLELIEAELGLLHTSA